jgi:hypothetical protein
MTVDDFVGGQIFPAFRLEPDNGARKPHVDGVLLEAMFENPFPCSQIQGDRSGEEQIHLKSKMMVADSAWPSV